MTEAPSTTTGGPRLERPLEGRVALGVCAGVAKHFNLDPTLVRVVFAVVSFLGGVGVVAYVAGYLLVPEEGREQPIVRGGSRGGRFQTIAGAILIAIGAIAILDNLDFGFHGEILWGALLVVAGGALMLRIGEGGAPALRVPWAKDDATGAATAGPAVAERPWGRAGDGPGDRRDPAEAPTAEHGGDDATAVHDWAGGGGTTAVHDRVGEGGRSSAFGGGDDEPPAEPGDGGRGGPPPRRGATAMVLGLFLVLAGVGVAVAGLGDFDLSWETGAGALVVLAGLGLAVGAFFGASPALVVPALLAAGAVAGLQAANVELHGGTGERHYRPLAAADVRPEYRLAAGDLDVDLRNTRLPPGPVTRIKATLGFGELQVQVPRDATVRVKAHAGAGQVTVFGDRDHNGIDVDHAVTRTAPRTPDRVIEIDARVGVGEIRVTDEGAPSPRSTSTSTIAPETP